MIYDFNRDGNNNNNNNEKINRNLVTNDRRLVYIQLREAVPATRTPSSPGPRLLSGDCGVHTVETRSTARTIPQFMGPHCSPPPSPAPETGSRPTTLPSRGMLLFIVCSRQPATVNSPHTLSTATARFSTVRCLVMAAFASSKAGRRCLHSRRAGQVMKVFGAEAVAGVVWPEHLRQNLCRTQIAEGRQIVPTLPLLVIHFRARPSTLAWENAYLNRLYPPSFVVRTRLLHTPPLFLISFSFCIQKDP